MGVIAKGILRGCQGLFTPVSLGYLLSVFNKNSTLKTMTAGNTGASIRDHVLDFVLTSLLYRRALALYYLPT